MIELAEDEVICYKCNGSGVLTHNEFFDQICTECNGTGKLDWIENVFGKEINSFNWNSMATNSGTVYVTTQDGSVWKRIDENEEFVEIKNFGE